MVAGILLLALAAPQEVGAAATAATAATATERPELVPLIQAAERLLLPHTRGPLALKVDPLGATIELSAPPRDVPALVAQVKRMGTSICPRWEARSSGLLLRCRTRRLQAKLSREGSRQYLDIQELRGLPREEPEDRLEVFYDPVTAGLGGPCPGTTAAGRGECALQEGKPSEAELQYKLAFGGTDRSLAGLRLGDLCARKGDYLCAVSWWMKAGALGPFGRLAAARVCELTGACLGQPIGRIFEGGELPQPMRTELLLRGARIDFYMGRPADGVRRIFDVLVRRTSGGCLTLGQRMCRRLLLAALEEGDPDTGRQAVELYLTLPNRTHDHYALDLGRAAARRSWQLGAPIFAANLHGSLVALVPPAELADHLLTTAEYYLAGQDVARAQLILDYSESRFEARRLAGARWAGVKKRISRLSEGAPGQRQRLDQIVMTSEAVRDLASALSLLARSRTLPPGM